MMLKDMFGKAKSVVHSGKSKLFETKSCGMMM